MDMKATVQKKKKGKAVEQVKECNQSGTEVKIFISYCKDLFTLNFYILKSI